MELKTDILQDKLKSSVIISTIGVIVPFAVSIPVSFFLYTSEYAMDSRYILIAFSLIVFLFSY